MHSLTLQSVSFVPLDSTCATCAFCVGFWKALIRLKGSWGCHVTQLSGISGLSFDFDFSFLSLFFFLFSVSVFPPGPAALSHLSCSFSANGSHALDFSPENSSIFCIKK